MHNLDTFAGNHLIRNTLKKYIASKNLFHATILQGDKGVGKKTLSKIIAKTLLCKKKGVNPCGVCKSCIKFDGDNHPDVIYLRLNTTDKKTEKSIGIKSVREVIHKSTDVRPYESEHKIFIVENADLLTVEAQNALLKTIEEPNKYNIFILIATNEKMFLPTILSRCIMLRLKPVEINESIPVILDAVKPIDINPNDAEKYAVFTRGNIGKAIKYIENENYKEFRDEIIDFLVNSANANFADSLLLSKDIANYKDNMENVFEIFTSWYRDLLVLKHREDNIFMLDYKDLLDKYHGQYSVLELCNIQDEIVKAKTRLRQNANFQMTMDVLFLKLTRKQRAV